MTIEMLAEFLSIKDSVLKGCSEWEISGIEKHYNIKLPQAYKDFLRLMGKGGGRFMLGSDVFYNEILRHDLREGAIELLEENNFKPLPGNTYVFFMHQGYQFAFFYLTDNDDPTVYYYYEGQKMDDFEEVGSFTDFLESQLPMSGLK